MFHKHVIFIKTVRVQQEQNSFPCCQLSLEQSKQQLTEPLGGSGCLLTPSRCSLIKQNLTWSATLGPLSNCRPPKLEIACVVIILLKNKHNASQTLKRRLTVGAALPQEKANNLTDFSTGYKCIIAIFAYTFKCFYKDLFSILNQRTVPQLDQTSPTAQGSIHNTQILFDCSK